jgi:asparaginyl-tRNA synthetase
MELYCSVTDYCVTKVLAAASYAGVSVTVHSGSTEAALLALHPQAKSMVLKTSSGYLTQQNTILRHLAENSATAGLVGSTPFESAQVDQWLDFFWNELDFRAQALMGLTAGAGVFGDMTQAHKQSVEDRVKADLPQALQRLDDYLEDKTFMVGESTTLADLSLCCIIATLSKLCVFDQDEYTNVFRHYMTVKHQPAMDAVMGTPKAAASSSISPSDAVGGRVPLAATATTFTTKWSRGRERVKELLARGEAAIGEEVTLKGWIRTSRSADKGQVLFVDLTDGSTIKGIQLVLTMSGTSGCSDVAGCGGVGASLSICGKVVASPAKGQTIEIQVTAATVLGAVYGGDKGEIGGKNYPLAKKQHGMEYLREQAHLRPRSKVFSSALRVRHAMAYAVHKFYNDRGFVYTHTPLITAADCEGAGEQFLVTTLIPEHGKTKDIPTTKTGDVDFTKDFFGRRCNLTVSGQLNVETHACALSDVYTFGPTFRAENSHTTRHLAEFWMIEPEICFADLHDDMALAEDFVKFCTTYALDHCADDLEYFEEQCPIGEKGLRARLRNVVESDFARISYTEAIELLQNELASGKVVFENEVFWGVDLNSEHERYISEKVNHSLFFCHIDSSVMISRRAVVCYFLMTMPITT